MKNRSATPKRRALSVGQMSASPELIGVKQMMKTPRATKTASLSPKLDGIRKLVKAPKLGKLPELHGARKAMKTPKAQMSPVLDGVRKLLKTPKEVAGSPTLDGVRRLVKTPKAQRSPSFAGMRKLLKTPKAQKSPQLAGVKSLLKTPKQQASPALLGVRQLMRTPKSVSQSPDLTGVHEMMTSPQTVSASPDLLLSKSVTMKKRGRNVSPAVVDVEPSPKPARARGKKVLEVQPSLKVFRSQAKKAVKKATENQKTEEVDIPSARKRHAAQRLTADDDPQVGTKRQKLAVSGSKSKSGKTPEKSVGIQAAGGSQQSSVGRSRRKGSRHPNAAIAPTESVGEVDATVAQAKPTKTPPRTRRGASKSSVSAALVHAEPKTSVGGSVKGSRTSKKTVDVYSSPLIVTTDTATGRRVVKEIVATETKKSGKSVMSADSVQSPKRVRGRLRKQAPAIVVAGVPQQHSVGRQTIALPPPAAEEEVQIVAHKSRGARKPRDADVHGDDKSVETVVVTPKPKGRSRSAKKVEVAVLLSSKTTVEPEIKTARGKGPSVRSPVVKPVTGRRTKAGSHVETVMSMPMGKSPVSTRRGKQTAAKELPPAHVSTEEKNLPSKAATGRKGKRRPIAVVEEAAEVESSNAVMPRKRRKATADDNQTSVVAEQPVAKQVKQRTTGRVVSMSTEPVVQPDKSKNKTGAKKVTIVTPVPEAVGKKNNQKSKEVESSSVSAQSERGEKCEKVVATVSPAATRTKRQMPVKAVGGKQSTKKSTVNSASSTPRGGKSVKSKTAIASPAATRSRRPKH